MNVIEKINNLYIEKTSLEGQITRLEKQAQEEKNLTHGEWKLSLGKKGWQAWKCVNGKKHACYLGTLENYVSKISAWEGRQEILQAEDLEELFDLLPWERKFEHKVPSTDIAVVFREKDLAKAKSYLLRVKEGTGDLCRGAWLGCDSHGQCLCVTEESWDK